MATAELYYDPLECTICLGTFKNPKILPCFHTFCLKCLEKHVSEDTVPASRHRLAYFTCPLCRKETTIPNGGVKAFQTNFYIDAVKPSQDVRQVAPPAFQSLPEELGSLELYPVNNSRTKSLNRDLLGDLRFKASKVIRYLSELKHDCRDYTDSLSSEAAEARKSVEDLRQKAHDLVNNACEITISSLYDVVKKETSRAEDYHSKVDSVIAQMKAIEVKAESGQVHGDQHVVSETLRQGLEEFTQVVNALPPKLEEKKSLCFRTQAVDQILTAQNVFGQVVTESAPRQQPKERKSAGTNTQANVGCSNTPPTQKSSAPKSNSQDSASSKDTCSKTTQKGCASDVSYTGNREDEADISYDSDSSVEVVENMPSLESDRDQRRLEGAVGGVSVSSTTHNSGAVSTGQEPKLLRFFKAPVAMEIRHIALHTTPGQAWVSYGQKEPTAYLIDRDGHQVRMVHTGGDAHDLTVVDQHTLVVANPSQKRIRQVEVDPDEGPIRYGQHTYRLPFPATCLAFNPAIRALAVAGKNNLQILSTDLPSSQMVIHGQLDILTKPSSVAFSRFSDLIVLAVADLGTGTVYIFAECEEADAKFTRENMFTYEGEGLGVEGLGQHITFQPVSVSGREDLLAVLDKTTESIALLGPEFSVISIIRQHELQVPEPRSIAFASHDARCWRVWLGTASGQVAVVDLPECLCIG